MKRFLAPILLILADLLTIRLSLYFAIVIRESLPFLAPHTIPHIQYFRFYPIDVFVLVLFAYEGIYTYRYDFWHESRLVVKALFFASILTFAYLAVTKTIDNYSRLVLGIAFLVMTVLIPLEKNIVKKLLFYLGIRKKSATVIGQDPSLENEIFNNPYLGYVKASDQDHAEILFFNASNVDDTTYVKRTLPELLEQKSDILFTPLVNDYDLSHSKIFILANIRSNLIHLENRLKSRYRMYVKTISDYMMTIALLPFAVPVLLICAWLIKNEHSGKSVLFTQERIGKNGKRFICYKFRTMYDDGDHLLQEYLKKHPEENEHYQKYHKYKNDPRVTPIGKILRKTSLDELPQIFNVLKGEMSLIGPRPYMPHEIKHMVEKIHSVMSVKPGITGLWQVSGRNELTYDHRIEIDRWYVNNWSLWLDIVILIKTIKTVLRRDGAY
ncbi:exopolysaccharide biosynthesis polyprenyl glycosylphosphotransferase [Nitratifractor sp.]